MVLGMFKQLRVSFYKVQATEQRPGDPEMDDEEASYDGRRK